MARAAFLIENIPGPLHVDGADLKAQVSRLDHSEIDQATWISLHEIDFKIPDPMVGFEASLRWYIEEYSLFEPFETARAKKVEAAIAEYGESLFTQLHLPDLAVAVGQSDSPRDSTDRHPTSTTSVELFVLENAADSAWGGVHWESLESLSVARKWPHLSIQVSRVSSRSLQQGSVQVMSTSQQTLNILVAVARPKQEKDIPYRKVTLPLTNVVAGFPREAICADVVGLGTWNTVKEALEDKAFGHYGIVHFDVHGEIRKKKAYLKFLPSDSSPSYIPADDVAQTLAHHGVRAVILNACSSARKPRPTQESLAVALLNHGMLFVIGMAYDVHEDAVFQFTRGLYPSLLDGSVTVMEAVTLARRSMQENPQRVGKFSLSVDVRDWLNPALYCRDPTTLRLMAPSRSLTPNLSSLRYQSTSDWPQGFFGRDWDIAKIETALRINKLTRIQGFRGAGKSTLTRHLAEWWKRTNFAEAVFMVDYSFTEEFDHESPKIYPTEIFSKIDGILSNRDNTAPDRCRIYEISPSQSTHPSMLLRSDLMTRNDAPNFLQALAHLNLLDGDTFSSTLADDDSDLFSRLRNHFSTAKYAVIFNSLHNVTSLASGGGLTFFSWVEDMKRCLERLDWKEWKSGMLFSSMLNETWLDDLSCQMTRIKGLNPFYATQYAHHIADIERYTRDALQRDYLERIMEYFDFQPLALQVAFRHLLASDAPPSTFFEGLLCGDTELKIDSEIPEQRQLAIDFGVAMMALPTWVPGLDAVQLYCPRGFVMEQLEGNGPFDAEENPTATWDEMLETLQDFSIVVPMPAQDDDTSGSLSTADLQLHPLFSAHLRRFSRELEAPEDWEPADMTFVYLVHYLAQRSCEWDDDNGTELEYSLTRDALDEIGRNWFNILAALHYCLSRPYLWHVLLERAFDFLMKRVIYYATFSKPREKILLTRIERLSIDRIARAFAGQDATLLTPGWWSSARLATTQDEERARFSSNEEAGSIRNYKKIIGDQNHVVMPGWLFRRVATAYCSLRVDAWQVFDPVGWDYNNMLMGLLEWRKAQLGQVPDELRLPGDELFFNFMEQEVKISAAEIAYQSGNHYPEGMMALRSVDLSHLPDTARDVLEVRRRDTHAMLFGFVMTEEYEGDSGTMEIVRKAEADGVLPQGQRTARAIVTRRAYETAKKSKDQADIDRAKNFIYQELGLVENPIDPYPVALHRFLFDLFALEKSWASALKQLQMIEGILDSNPERFHSILHEDGPESYRLQLHQDFIDCYTKLGNRDQAEEHRKEYESLLERRNAAMETEEEREKLGMENLLAALTFSLQTSGVEAPTGYRTETFERAERSRSQDGDDGEEST